MFSWNPYSWLAAIYDEVKYMQAEIQVLHDLVLEQRTVVDSAVALIKGLHEKLDAAVANNDMAAVEAIVVDLKANTDALAAAVAANTEADPVDPPVA